jgi:hypothetical protein
MTRPWWKTLGCAVENGRRYNRQIFDGVGVECGRGDGVVAALFCEECAWTNQGGLLHRMYQYPFVVISSTLEETDLASKYCNRSQIIPK